MSGYRWDPVFRVVPQNGAAVIYWLADLLTDAKAPTSISLRYPEAMDVREDINRSLRPVVFGVRPEVTFEFQILTMADQSFLAEIENALLRPRDFDVYLSLDGGLVERRVVLASGAEPTPLRGKTFVGASFTLTVRCRDLIDAKPAMMTDPGTGEELTRDGGIEVWSGGAPTNWSGSSGVGTVAQETSIIHGGASSAKVTRSDGVTFFSFVQSLVHAPRQGAWYRARCWVRGSSTMAATVSGPARLQIIDATNALLVGSDGKTWGGSGDLVIAGVDGASFGLVEAYFRASSAVAAEHDVAVRMAGYWATGESLYYDDVSVYGPVLRPGYATW